jgi:hypothetical protein
MSALAKVQHAVQSFVLEGHAGAQNEIASTDALSAIARLGIYSEAYRLRLTEALASNYPRLKQAIGEAQFDSLALRYIEMQRSHHPSIRWYGERLSEFIATARPTEPWLAELATWEWAVAAAFDARDAETIDASALTGIQPEQWSELRLAFHPSIQRIDLYSNVTALFKALTEETAPPMPRKEALSAWVIWRQELKTQYRSLSVDEAAVLDSMRAGGSFAEACELLCDWHDAEQVPLRAATHMQRWLHDQLICALR